MRQDVIAVFPSYEVAARRIDELIRSGVSPSRIHVTTVPEGVQVAVEARAEAELDPARSGDHA
jgi:cytosine/adenosine deaminase-related metal-dependent hydrolase